MIHHEDIGLLYTLRKHRKHAGVSAGRQFNQTFFPMSSSPLLVVSCSWHTRGLFNLLLACTPGARGYYNSRPHLNRSESHFGLAIRHRARMLVTSHFFVILSLLVAYSISALRLGRTKHAVMGRHSLYMAGFGSGGGGASSKNDSKKSKGNKISKPLSELKETSNGLMPADALLTYSPALDLKYKGIRVVHKDPYIFEIDGFFDDATCDRYISMAEEQGDAYASGKFSSTASSTRSSTTWYMPYPSVPEFLSKISDLLGKDINTFEEPQVVRYELGQQFTWHYDALPKSMVDDAGQRIGTIIIYLNDCAMGGATVFKDLGPLQIKPVKGKALLFFPCNQEGKEDDRTMHAGQVAMDTKWIAQTWIRQQPYTPTVPNTVGTQQAGIEAASQWKKDLQ